MAGIKPVVSHVTLVVETRKKILPHVSAAEVRGTRAVLDRTFQGDVLAKALVNEWLSPFFRGYLVSTLRKGADAQVSKRPRRSVFPLAFGLGGARLHGAREQTVNSRTVCGGLLKR